MWKIALFFLIAISVFVPSESCSYELHQKCYVAGEPEEVPENKEELDAFCEYGLKYFECVKNTEYECDNPASEFPNFVEEIYPALKRICLKDTLLNQALVKSLPCIKKVMYEFSCTHRDFDEINMEDLMATLTEEELASNKNDTDDCMRTLLDISCFPVIVGITCDEIARDVLVEIMQQFNMPFEPCNLSVKEKLPAIVEALQLTMIKELEARSALKKRK